MAGAFSRMGRWAGRAALGGLRLALAALMAWLVFLLLPLLEQAARPKKGDLELRSIGAVDLPPPPPPPPTETEKEPEPEEAPPNLAEPAAPMDLASLELALNPTFGDGTGGDFVLRLPGMDGAGAQEETEAIFDAADLDQMPRPVQQSPPAYPPDLRRQRIAGTVQITFVVDRSGRVTQPAIERAPHPRLGTAAVEAVRKWRFEPGKRQGNPVPFKMRVPITFVNQ